ncbi:Ankyrin repeat-containing protein [Microlunatus sagamiharensis]|uniref:Ankyrin repeat-containing protein n=1 Tax=Microlunatus sagamiharensis TaxID=546874 RepID=A0A1H2MZW2_9ACTN|nr:ankyrin repeat domain-containing protein [Microlunatus sagamiharensis]SDU98528.1 Ankyrin repeat-containing protein [Microlunatus sagamiharensis]
MTAGPGAGEDVLALARLTYLDDGPDRWARAEALLAEHPGLVAEDPFVAAAVGDAEAVRRHLRRDPGLATATRREDGWTALMCLAYARVRQRDPYATARLLLDAGADPDAGVQLGGRVPPFTVLTGCFGEGEQGPGRTPRHPQGDLLAGLLLERGADPHDGQALYDRMFARDDGHLRLLLAHGLGRGDAGAWRRRLGERQDSPQRMVALQVDWAREHGLTDRLALLAAHGFTDGTPADEPSPWRERQPLPPVFASATPLGVRRVVSEGADPDARAHGRTLLHHAAWIGDVELVSALLEVGADPQVRDDAHDATPLGWAEWAYADATAALLRPVTRAGTG